MPSIGFDSDFAPTVTGTMHQAGVVRATMPFGYEVHLDSAPSVTGTMHQAGASRAEVATYPAPPVGAVSMS